MAPTSFHTCGVRNLSAVAIKRDTMRHLRKAVALRVLWIPEWRAQRTCEQNRKVRTSGLWRLSATGLEMALHRGVRDGVATCDHRDWRWVIHCCDLHRWKIMRSLLHRCGDCSLHLPAPTGGEEQESTWHPSSLRPDWLGTIGLDSHTGGAPLQHMIGSPIFGRHVRRKVALCSGVDIVDC
jgi:hypothetical protein